MDKYEKFKSLVKEMFQMDKPDLDFGMYRIMHARSQEIETFLDTTLKEKVEKTLKQHYEQRKAHIDGEIIAAEAAARASGINPEDAPRVKDLRAKSSDMKRAMGQVEADVYNHLITFFSRYYNEGDFISQRRYKDGTYVLPYEGEEVKLHWANHDQYYIKTTENFRSYKFNVGNGKSVTFKVVEADVDKDNRKPTADKERRFILTEEPLEASNTDLVIRFEYRADEDKRTREEIIESSVETLEGLLPRDWKELLFKETEAGRTLIEREIDRYTAKHTFDYFIHKDLGGFLRRELDHFIKNDIVRVDEIITQSGVDPDQYFAKAKLVLVLGGMIIDFLSQLENFQKKLWEKKKFVVDTGYCITLDLVPIGYYDAILKSEAQIEEWRNLGFVEGKNKLSIQYLKDHPTLSIDTKFFPEWRDKLLADFDDLDKQIDGVMINSENFASLNLLHERYREQLKLIYIDPPYNAPGTSEILYKNSFYHSSWLSLIENRLCLSRDLISNNSSVVVAIDENEQERLGRLMESLFPTFTHTCACVIHNKKGVQGKYFSYNNEFAYFAIGPDVKKLNEKPIPENEWEYSSFRNWGSESLRSDAKNCFYPVYVDQELNIVGFGGVSDDNFHPGSSNVVEGSNVAVYPIDQNGIERKWRFERGTVEGIINLLKVEKDVETGRIEIKKAKNTEKLKTVWDKKVYIAGDFGTKLLSQMGFDKSMFSFPKSVYLVQDSIFATTDQTANVCDFFAGSGTTGHAVLKLNRDDNNKEPGSGKRRYILVEMGAYFDTVTKPRMQKVVYSDEWKDGKPQDDGESGTRKHIIKYFKLESYEDTLNNLELVRSASGTTLFQSNSELQTDYLLNYMLETESSGSLLNVDSFKNPFEYKLKIATDTVGEAVETPVDLVETFNYLIGLKVKRQYWDNGFKVITGENLVGEKITVIWRNMEDKDDEALRKWFELSDVAQPEVGLNRIYVNGSNTLNALRGNDTTWTVEQIEPEFLARMFNEK